MLPGNCAILVLFDKFNPFQRLERNELLITCEIKLSSKWGENKISYIDGVLGDGNYLEVVGHKDCFSSNHLMCNTIFKDRNVSEFHQIKLTKKFKQYLSDEIDVVLVKINSRQTKNLVNIMLVGLNGTMEKKQYGLTAHQPDWKMSDFLFGVALSTTWSLGLDWILGIDRNITIGPEHKNTFCFFTLERNAAVIFNNYTNSFLSLLEIKWMMSLDLLSLHQKHYISILGRHKSFEINCEGFIPPKMSHIYVTSCLEDYYNDFISRHFKFCHYQTQYMYCQPFRKNNLEYLVYGKVSNFYPHQHVYEKIYYSWLKGNRFCKRLGYELPYFMSRDELDDFKSLLHGSGSIPYLEAVFVGLFYNNQKVSFCCIIDY